MPFDFKLPYSSAFQPTTELEFGDRSEDMKSPQFRLPSRVPDFSKVTVSLILAPFLFVVAIVYTIFLGGLGQRPDIWMQNQSLSCRNPIVRREWRTLGTTERQIYLKAVQCLWEQPSRIGLNHSLYEDFPWVHSRMGNFCMPTQKNFPHPS